MWNPINVQVLMLKKSHSLPISHAEIPFFLELDFSSSQITRASKTPSDWLHHPSPPARVHPPSDAALLAAPPREPLRHSWAVVTTGDLPLGRPIGLTCCRKKRFYDFVRMILKLCAPFCLFIFKNIHTISMFEDLPHNDCLYSTWASF